MVSGGVPIYPPQKPGVEIPKPKKSKPPTKGYLRTPFPTKRKQGRLGLGDMGGSHGLRTQGRHLLFQRSLLRFQRAAKHLGSSIWLAANS